MTEDTELLRRYAVEGSETAFAAVVHRRIGFVYSLALRQTRNRQWAEEVVQRVFISLARHATKLSHRETLLGWLHATTQNSAPAGLWIN